MLSETGSEHLHVIAEEVCRVAELCIGQGNPTRFVAFGWGLHGCYHDGWFGALLIRNLLLCNGGVKRTSEQANVVEDIANCYAYSILSTVPLKQQVNMGSDPRLNAALKILRDAGHQIGDMYFAPEDGGILKIWIDGVPCTLRGVLRMAEEEIEAKDEEKPESPG